MRPASIYEVEKARLDSLSSSRRLAENYLELVKRTLMGVTYRMQREIPEHVVDGRYFVAHAFTMIGRHRLDNLHARIDDVLRDGVPGDVLEAGVWRGGASILARAVLEARGDEGRRVHVADSFRGLPPPVHAADAAYAAIPGVNVTVLPILAVPLEEVRDNFGRFGFADDPRVVFHEGWFRDTLPKVDGPLSVIRLDGDFYESTTDALEALYPKLSSGGFVLVDDYGAVPPMCGAAVDDFRRRCGIEAPLVKVDWTEVYWRKP